MPRLRTKKVFPKVPAITLKTKKKKKRKKFFRGGRGGGAIRGSSQHLKVRKSSVSFIQHGGKQTAEGGEKNSARENAQNLKEKREALTPIRGKGTLAIARNRDNRSCKGQEKRGKRKKKKKTPKGLLRKNFFPKLENENKKVFSSKEGAVLWEMGYDPFRCYPILEIERGGVLQRKREKSSVYGGEVLVSSSRKKKDLYLMRSGGNSETCCESCDSIRKGRFRRRRLGKKEASSWPRVLEEGGGKCPSQTANKLTKKKTERE